MANLQLPLNQNHESKQNSQFSFESCAAVLFVCLPFSFVLKTSIVIFKGEIAYFDKGQKILFVFEKYFYVLFGCPLSRGHECIKCSNFGPLVIHNTVICVHYGSIAHYYWYFRSFSIFESNFRRFST